MNCDQVDRLLDELMDDVISAENLDLLETHCETCPACAEKLNATRDMKRLFSDMAPEVDVPLETQAKWRRAVRAEADKRGMKRFYRLAGGIAAVLVVAFGATFALRSQPAQMQPMTYESRGVDQNIAMIETDGAMEESISTAASRAMPMHEVAMTVADLDRTCEYMADLVSEYEGSMDEQRFDEDGRACANLYIELPAENAAEFLNAASHYDVEDRASAVDIDTSAEERVSVLLVLKEA